jgi:tetratricopeptide (TPR) repeat protein
MRCAIVVALGDPRSPDAGTWIDAVGLRQELTELDYRVALIDGEDVERDIERALEDVTTQDDVLLHVSGRLVDRGVVRTAGGRGVHLREIGDILAAHAAANVSLFAELMYGGPEDALIAAEHVASVVGDVQARARGFAMVAAVRAASASIRGLALTRLFLRVARASRQDGVILSSAIYERIVDTPESLACAQSFTFVRADVEPWLAPPPLAPDSPPLPFFESEPLPSFESPSLPSSESGLLPGIEPPLPSFASDLLPAVEPPLPSFASELPPAVEPPLPSFASLQPLPSFDSEPSASYPAEPLPSFDSLPPTSLESETRRTPASPSSPPTSPALPADEGTLDERIARATEAQQWRSVVELRRERMRTIESGRLRVRELVAIARILQFDLDGAEGALEALEEARAIDPMRIGVLQALRRGYERLGRWEHAIEVIGSLAELTASPTERAELRVSQAAVALDKLDDQERAFTFLQMALENDPAHERALAAFEDVCARRAGIRREPAASTEDGAGPRRELKDVAPSTGAVSTEGGQREPIAHDPADPAAHASAFAVHWRDGRTDAAFLAALALEELGATDVDQQILVDQFRTVAPIRALGTLDASAWTLLRAAGGDDALSTLFAQVARAAVATRLEQLVERQRLVALDPEKRLDEKSTASVVRSFQWAARVLGVPCPALYVVDHVPGEIAAVRAHQPSTAVGPSVLRGRSAKELAFLAGRHLTYYLPEHQVLVYFPTGADLARLLIATIELGAPRRSGASRDRAVAALRDRLSRCMTQAEREAIATAVHRIDREADLGTWARSVELTAGRAGLLLSGDLATATSIVRSESRAIAGLSPDDRRRDLIAFCASPAHTALRARFAVTAPESLQPPPAATRTATELADPSA